MAAAVIQPVGIPPVGLARNPGVFACLAALLLLCSSSAWSQARPAENMPPWTVLVLRLVSATHVQPTTGIVIAAPDTVLVAVDFAREGDEIMVLDGGTDIVRHGRPASIIHTLPADRLAILKVQGLNRPAASLSATSLAGIRSLGLVAFPPAEEIAQGAAPVRAEVKTLAAITTAYPSLEPFPNVSGALTDACGNLVAFNLAAGIQSMEPVNSPRVVWADGLERAATLAGTQLQQAAACPTGQNQQAEEADRQTETEKPPEPAAAEEPPAPAEPDAGENSAAAEELPKDQLEEPVEEAVEETAEETLGELQHEAEATPDPEPAPVMEADPTGSASNDSTTLADDASSPRRLGLVGGVIALLALLLWLVWWLRLRRPASSRPGPLPANLPVEPGTVRFDAANAGAPGVMLRITGKSADGEEILRELPVSGPAWTAELGRQEADVDLGSPAVSRRHARLQLHEGRITLSDLDSTNGTRLNGVACLPGEVFFVQAEDHVQLGDVSLSLQLTVGED